MKSFAAALAGILLLFSCSKESESSLPVRDATGLTGSWQLTSYYVSSGGPGIWQDADREEPRFLEFRDDGAISFIPDNQYNAKSYKVTSDTTLLLIREQDTLMCRYTLSASELELMPPCIEGCMSKYKPVNRD